MEIIFSPIIISKQWCFKFLTVQPKIINLYLFFGLKFSLFTDAPYLVCIKEEDPQHSEKSFVEMSSFSFIKCFFKTFTFPTCTDYSSAKWFGALLARPAWTDLRIHGYLIPIFLSYSNSGRVPCNIFLHLLLQKYLYSANIPGTVPRHGDIYIIQN